MALAVFVRVRGRGSSVDRRYARRDRTDLSDGRSARGRRAVGRLARADGDRALRYGLLPIIENAVDGLEGVSV